jgi:threonine/homoserine efflux transporter RhtA
MILLKIGLWILNLMCLSGQILVTKKDKRGVMLWIVADTLWAIYNFHINQIEQGLLWAAYTIISIWQYRQWSKK